MTITNKNKENGCASLSASCKICKNISYFTGAELKFLMPVNSGIKCACDGGEPISALRRIPLFAVIMLLAFVSTGQVSHVIHNAMADAYIAVSSFVAVTLFFFYLFDTYIKIDKNKLLEKYANLHVPIASLIGVLPGCGGAIVVITQYVSGKTGFASVVAVLASTMGDAAFLLLAQEPKTALVVYLFSLIAGVITGYAVELIHGKDFLRQEVKEDFSINPQVNNSTGNFITDHAVLNRKKILRNLLIAVWIILIIVGFALGIGNAFQVDTDNWFSYFNFDEKFSPTLWIGVTGAVLCSFAWLIFGSEFSTISSHKQAQSGEDIKPFNLLLQRVVADTSFVTVWVIMAFVLYELAVLLLGLDLKNLFNSWSFALPMIGVLIGFIPGCGPQILVTTAYLNGLVPFSVQLGNAISNDGDALFPAIAMAPKAALIATIYTAIPALVIAYGWFILFE